ncbi:DUF721 domain-containing protein [Jannaschia sp. LMIT008]|uniref:DUF721 domain-containing protein n=1 Tax=Jannaschia maritima TaxID=3032585 RepID=UPI002811AC0C|nr:DciA family protein [Jannaschia sp. LMIT008]
MNAKGQRRGRVRSVGTLLDRSIKHLGESRGFSQARLLTHWAEIVGRDLAAISTPVKVGHSRQGLGAVLTLLTAGPNAPVLQMRLPILRDRVNACYGYNAIARIEVTQTAPAGFVPAPVQTPAPRSEPGPAHVEAARDRAAQVGDADLRAALERLGANVICRSTDTREPT